MSIKLYELCLGEMMNQKSRGATWPNGTSELVSYAMPHNNVLSSFS